MSDLISRSELIKTLEEYKEEDWNKTLCTMLPNVVDDCIDFIENMPTAIVKQGCVSDDVCEWKLEDEEANLYLTECQQRQLIFEGTPKENEYRYCPYCSKKIKEVE